MMIAAAFVLSLLFLQLPRIPGSELLFKSKVCGTNHLAFSGPLDDKILFVNGRLVEKITICNALRYQVTNGYPFEEYCYTDLCGLDHLQVKFTHSSGRTLLQTHMKEGDVDDASCHLSGNKGFHRTLLSHKTMVVVLPGMFALCCFILCPCIHGKRKEMPPNAVLAKDPSPVASLTVSKSNSAPGNIPGSPLSMLPSPRFSTSQKLHRLGSIHLNLNQVVKATRNFSPSMVIGEGGFGTLYKAELEDGQLVAIKRANKEHFESLKTEFSSEVELLAKIDHRCLVNLLGYLDEGNERLIIIEYIPNGTLREHLDGVRNGILDFNQRLEIAIDVAHGLTYLHLYAEKQIIHRDVNSSTILLTNSMRAKVADFGFATLGTAPDSNKTHVSTKVKGTVGYLDPVYLRTFQLTTKSDVYSFGILLLEILTGRRPLEQNRSVEDRVTLRWVFRMFDEGNVEELVDPRLEEVVDREILVRIISLAIQCAAPVRSERPDMKIVGEQLWAIRVDYLKTLKRGY